MSNSQTAALQPYFGLIDEGLAARNVAAGDYEPDPAHNVPLFVSRMCAVLAKACSDRRGELVDIKQVLKVECMAAGHFDYHRKLALYCTELERGTSTVRP